MIITLSINDATVTPGVSGAPAVFTVMLSAAVGSPVAVQFSTREGTASAGAGDYVGVAAGGLVIPAGQTKASIAIDVKPHAAGSAEKTFSVYITTNTPGIAVAKSLGTGTIKPAPAPAPIATPPPTQAPAAATPATSNQQPATTTINVPAGANLVTVFIQAKPGQTLQLAAATYVLPVMATLSASNVTVVGSPSGTTIQRKSVAGSTTGILIAGNDIEFANIAFDSDKPLGKPGTPGWNAKVSVNAFRVTGENFYIHGCTARNVDDFVYLQISATGAVIQANTTTDELRGDAVYIESTQNVTVSGNAIAGSQNEHGIRLDTVDNKTPPRYITITDNTISNSDGKESIAIRWGWNVTVDANQLNAWTRANQGATTPPTPNQCAGNVTYTNNTFGPGAYITINPYTSGAIIHGNTFNLRPQDVGIELQGPNVAADVADNRKIASPAGGPLKPLIHTYGAVTVTGDNAADHVAS